MTNSLLISSSPLIPIDHSIEINSSPFTNLVAGLSEFSYSENADIGNNKRLQTKDTCKRNDISNRPTSKDQENEFQKVKSKRNKKQPRTKSLKPHLVPKDIKEVNKPTTRKRKKKEKGPVTLNERILALMNDSKSDSLNASLNETTISTPTDLPPSNNIEQTKNDDDKFQMEKLLSGKPNRILKSRQMQRKAQSKAKKQEKSEVQAPQQPIDLLLSPEDACNKIKDLKLIFPTTPRSITLEKRLFNDESPIRAKKLCINNDKDISRMSLFEFAAKLPSDFELNDAEILYSGELTSSVDVSRGLEQEQQRECTDESIPNSQPTFDSVETNDCMERPLYQSSSVQSLTCLPQSYMESKLESISESVISVESLPASSSQINESPIIVIDDSDISEVAVNIDPTTIGNSNISSTSFLIDNVEAAGISTVNTPPFPATTVELFEISDSDDENITEDDEKPANTTRSPSVIIIGSSPFTEQSTHNRLPASPTFNISSARYTFNGGDENMFDLEDTNEIPQSPGYFEDDLSSYLPYDMSTDTVMNRSKYTKTTTTTTTTKTTSTEPIVQSVNLTPSLDYKNKYERMTTDELRQVVSKFGFKPKRARKAMIELLLSCHSEINSTITTTNTTVESTIPDTISNSSKSTSISSDDIMKKLFSRITNEIKTNPLAKAWWKRILIYEPLPIESFHNFIKNDLLIDIDITVIKSWCDSRGVCFTTSSNDNNV